MAWVRWGDGSAMHPLLLAVLEHPECDDRLLNEVHGFVSRCAAQSGQHSTDYVVTRGTAIQIAGPTRVETLLAVCLFAELMTEVQFTDSGRAVVAYKLVDDDPEFLHLRLKKEIEWERQRKADQSRPNLIVPVRLRDGDACRWCGRIVDWSDRKSGRAGTYDHLNPGEAATIDTYVVCCKACNSSRQDDDLPHGVPALLDPPAEPYFSRYSVEWLTQNKWRKTEGLPVPTAATTYIPPGRFADGSQPPAPDPTTTPNPTSSTRVAPSAPSTTPTPTRTADHCSASSAPERTADHRSASSDSTSTRTADHCSASSTPGDRVGPSQVPADPDPTRTADHCSASSDPDRTSTPGHDLPPPDTTSAPTTEHRSARYLLDPDRSGQIAGVRDLSEPVGTGRVGTGRVGSTDLSPPLTAPLRRRRSRGGRARRKPEKGDPTA